jgi:thymidylate kinase
MGKVRAGGRLQATTLPAWTEFDRFPGYGFMVWHLLTARDRHREYRSARRVAGAGGIALCDRFPTGSISLMDSPRTTRVPGTSRRPLARWLVERESAYYREILPPDLLIVLRVSPEVAVQRRHDEEPDFVTKRAAEVFGQHWEGWNAVVIDAEQPHDEVLAEVKAAVWAAL